MKAKLLVMVLGGALLSGEVASLFNQEQHKKPTPPKETALHRVERIYDKIRAVSGLAQMVPPIFVDSGLDFNAYNTGQGIVVYQGLINQIENDDELALVIAHEMSHTTLMHMTSPGLNDKNLDSIQTVLESMADKMGAFYMMRAGYDICKGREFFVIMNKATGGDFLNGDHPPNAYRYEQLNFNCKPSSGV